MKLPHQHQRTRQKTAVASRDSDLQVTALLASHVGSSS